SLATLGLMAAASTVTEKLSLNGRNKNQPLSVKLRFRTVFEWNTLLACPNPPIVESEIKTT
ncbi:hypothetical protein UO95_20055, partial [Escherichia coli]